MSFVPNKTLGKKPTVLANCLVALKSRRTNSEIHALKQNFVFFVKTCSKLFNSAISLNMDLRSKPILVLLQLLFCVVDQLLTAPVRTIVSPVKTLTSQAESAVHQVDANDNPALDFDQEIGPKFKIAIRNKRTANQGNITVFILSLILSTIFGQNKIRLMHWLIASDKNLYLC